ncbi:Alpha/Beta hydrolase protein [Vararia minispora EC-137]|uniref:Alpha/Beta hydrolase protein n=1 Tax=Vararia minispora EC-137 TaxID=1314806 RepID=A0ACB8QBN8_9AGAM|nr:Alpha/Beta hydrolase protein [Vararia minispora EC-137]
MTYTVHDLRSHPLRTLYLIYQALSTALVRIPWWILIYLPRRFRQRPSWSLQKAVMMRLVEHMQGVTSRTDTFRIVGDHLRPSSGRGVKQIWIEPVSGDLVSDQLRVWMEAGHVAPAHIPAYWIDKKGLESTPAGALASPSERILLYLHGGAYVRFSASPKDVIANNAKGILENAPSVTRALSVEYRLSKGRPEVPANAFPAALLDALAAYIYLVRTVNVSPENIVITGDSAGANLAHALTRYLVENVPTGSGLPPVPGALLLLSPWADLSNSHAATWNPAQNADYLGGPDAPLNKYARRAFLGPHGEDGALSRYVSPASINPRAEEASFVGFPRTMIIAGGAESLIRSITTLTERMRRDLGDQLTYYEAKDAVHDFLVFEFWEPERTETLKAIAEWIESADAQALY